MKKILVILAAVAALCLGLISPAQATTSPDGTLTISAINQVMKSGCVSYPNLHYTVSIPADALDWNLSVDISKSGAIGDNEFAYGSSGGVSSGNLLPFLCDNLDGLGTYTVGASLSWDDANFNSHNAYATASFALTTAPIAPSKTTLTGPKATHYKWIVALTGRVTYAPHGVYIPVGGRVSIYTRNSSKANWRAVGTVSTNAAGNYSVRYTASRTISCFLAKYPGSTGRVAASAATVCVPVVK